MSIDYRNVIIVTNETELVRKHKKTHAEITHL